MNHVLYGLVAGHRQRRALGQILAAAPELATVDVDLVALQRTGTSALVFDFDGVLAPHGADAPLNETRVVLEKALSLFGKGHVYILSNKPSQARIDYFNQHLSGVRFIGGVRKKPFPDGLQKIAELGGYSAGQIALIDDRLLTGGLSCLNAGAKFIYITRPYADFGHRPLKEFFFACLRYLEATLSRLAA